jgi:hypothetical protein
MIVVQVRRSYQRPISILIVAVVVIAAWLTGRGRPVPWWITRGIIPALGWVYIVFGAWWVANRIIRWRRRS